MSRNADCALTVEEAPGPDAAGSYRACFETVLYGNGRQGGNDSLSQMTQRVNKGIGSSLRRRVILFRRLILFCRDQGRNWGAAAIQGREDRGAEIWRRVQCPM